ncbi:hypothetical protein B0H16DRAFT_1883697 [Mycena metata]|uniref:Uncharacterized protein n=1 Tax=Mycena metata TaxID=1033252 RepID=A0AAD7JGH0_9AGAR|nr:hypothetical protein B0H16DRAFT_1883697 [Mycena metata]
MTWCKTTVSSHSYSTHFLLAASPHTLRRLLSTQTLRTLLSQSGMAWGTSFDALTAYSSRLPPQPCAYFSPSITSGVDVDEERRNPPRPNSVLELAVLEMDATAAKFQH